MKSRMMEVEFLLADGQEHSEEELRQNLRKTNESEDFRESTTIGIRALQKILKNLEDIYDGSNTIIRRRKPTRYSLLSTTELVFPENIFNYRDRDILASLMKLLVVFDGALPVGKMLSQLKINHSQVKDFFYGKIDFEYNAYLTEWITPLYNSITNKEIIYLEYEQLIDKERIKNIVSPYCLRNFNNRWFLIGHIHQPNSFDWSLFALDRIKKIDKYKGERIFKPIDVKNILDYYKHVVGYYVPVRDKDNPPRRLVINNQDCIRVVFKVLNPMTKEYIKSNPIHKESQKYIGNNTFELTVIENQLLLARLLSYGNDLEVLEPISIREKMLKNVTNMLDMYKKNK